MLYTGSIFAPPKPGSAPRGMYYLAAWGPPVFFRMPLGISVYIAHPSPELPRLTVQYHL